MPILNVKIRTTPSPQLSSRIAAALTDLTVEMVIKEHASIRGKKVVTLPKYIPAEPKVARLCTKLRNRESRD